LINWLIHFHCCHISKETAPIPAFPRRVKEKENKCKISVICGSNNMKDKQNEFYTSISKYYSAIFPFQPAQLQFVKSNSGDLTGKQILDIGCATGELAFQLAKTGAFITAIDLNQDLLKQALAKTAIGDLKTVNPAFKKRNMLKLDADFQPGQFDVVLCFGNTLVHLQTPELIAQMFTGVSKVLKRGGQFLLQMLNYDYILAEQITSLPAIETELIKFIRKYQFNKNSALIEFQTELLIKSENKTVCNSSPLLALQSDQLYNLLQNSGFSGIEFFSGFTREPFGGKHLPLVVSCRI